MNFSFQSPRDLGVPVKGLNWVRLFPGRRSDGSPLVLATMGQDADCLFMCDIDLESGHCHQYSAHLAQAAFPTAAVQDSQTGVLYVGSAYTGHLHRYDPNALPHLRQLEDVGPIDSEWAQFPCGIDIAPDGALYIGAYPGCCLCRYQPATGEWTRWGRMDPTDMYFYPLCGKDGTVAGLVKMCRMRVVVIDPHTGRKADVGPVIEKQTDPTGKINLYKGADGLLYIESSRGNFRVAGMQALPVNTLPPPYPAATLPDGSQVSFKDAQQFQYRTLGVQSPAGTVKEWPLDWEGAGTTIYLVHEGPDGRIYGSSILPEHLFSCRPDGSDMRDHGQCSLSGGEVYSFGNLGGKLYISSYPAARLSIYDPAKPYRFGTDPDANPRDLGPTDPISYRPRTQIAGPAGKVWIGSIPDYGTWGGTLVNFDPITEKFTVHRHLIENCNVVSLAWDEDRQWLVVGTSIEGGSGTQPKATEAGFVIWDVHADRAVRTTTFGDRFIHGIPDLIYAGQGQIYAIVVYRRPDSANYSAELLLIDLVEDRVISRSPFGEDGWPLEMSLRRSDRGTFYGLCYPYVYRITPGTTQREIIWSTSIENTADHIRAQGPIIGQRLFFGSHHRLRCLDLPE
jgi:hypothetical protein